MEFSFSVFIVVASDFYFFFLSFPFCGSIFRGKWKLGAELDGSRLPEYLFDSTAGDTVWEDAPE